MSRAFIAEYVEVATGKISFLSFFADSKEEAIGHARHCISGAKAATKLVHTKQVRQADLNEAKMGLFVTNSNDLYDPDRLVDIC